MTRALIEAAALLRNAHQLWTGNATTPTGQPIPAAGATIAELTTGIPPHGTPGPHHCPCEGRCDCPCPTCACDVRLTSVEAAVHHPDPLRSSTQRIDVALARVTICATTQLLDINPGPWLNHQPTIVGLYIATRLTELCSNLDLTVAGQRDAQRILDDARIVRDEISRWAWTPHRPTDRTLAANQTHSDDWCRSCLRLQRCEPIRALGLCRWCQDFRHAWQQDPPIAILFMHHDGRRITEADVARHLITVKPKKRKRAS